MELSHAINLRHSYRDEFETKPVSREALTQIVEAGIRAPSGYNAQSTRFVIVDDKPTLRQVLSCIGNGIHLRTAQAAIVVIMDPDAAGNRDFTFGVQDYAAAVENMLLTIADLGYATVWIEGGVRRARCAGQIAEVLGVPKPLGVEVVLPLGVPKQPQKQHERKPFEERAWFNRYGGE